MAVAEPVAELDAATIRELILRLRPAPDEPVVVSIAATQLVGESAARLVFASALFTPPTVATESWAQWSARTKQTVSFLVGQWEAAGVDVQQWVQFEEVRGNFLFGRAVLAAGNATDELTEWLTALLAGQPVNLPLSDGAQFAATAAAPTGLIQCFPLIAGPAATLTCAAARPITGYLFPLEVPAGAPAADPTWTVGDYAITNAPLFLLGLPISVPPIHAAPFETEAPAPPGLLVGRMQRDAWISNIRAEPDADHVFKIAIGHDPTRVSLADLELDLEEYAHGDLIGARRVRLGDVMLPELPEGIDEPVIGVCLPTLGPGLHRQVRLYDRDGLLLDTTDRLPMVEQVKVDVQVEGGIPFTITVGNAPIVALLDRLARADETDQAYDDLLAAGLAGRIIDSPGHGLPWLAQILAQAPGHLDVLDPYFGWNVSDWAVLNSVAVPTRVLTHRDGRNVISPPAGSAPGGLVARAWSGRPPWHDRVYLWDGGGATVGTSPSGLGQRVARIDRFGAAEAAGWQALFNTWWVDPSLTAV